MDATSAANQYLNAGRYDDLSTLGGKYIRLLGIDTASSHMKCTLRTVNLDERPQYTALSYVWGDLSDIRFIECNGSPLSITKNLDVALQHLWTRPGSFWIDAICINQADLSERAAQVSLMGDIYANASETIIWLGEPGEHGHWGMKTCQKLA